MAAKARKRHKPRRRTAVAGGHSRARRRTRGPARPDPATRAAKRAAAWKLVLPAVLFVVCFGAYVSNGDFLPGNDQVGNMLFSVNLLKRHSLSVSPPDAPDSFFWTLQQSDGERQRVTIDRWNSAADEAYRQGRLQAPSHYYYLSATTRPDVYVNTFGLGAALAGLPVYAVLDLFVDIEADRYWWWHGGALTASLLTAFAALFVFLAARGFVKPLPAFLVALAFGVGSCVWPISSQALWQHPANTFFLSLGAWFLLRRPERTLNASWCGAAFGMAVLCRPATAVVVVCAGAYLLWVNRRRLRRLRAWRVAVPGDPCRVQQPLLRQPARIRAERGVEDHRVVQHRFGEPVAELLAGESCRDCSSAPRGVSYGSRRCSCSGWSARWRCGESRATAPCCRCKRRSCC